MAKTLEVSPVPFVNRVVKAPVIMQINQATKHDAIPQIRHIDNVRQWPSINQVTKHVVTPPPVAMSRQSLRFRQWRKWPWSP